MDKLNVHAVVRLSQLALRKFLERDSRRNIHVGSGLSFHTLPLSAMDGGTQGDVLNFTRGVLIATWSA